MTQVRPNKQSEKFNSSRRKYTYQEIVLYLDSHWNLPITSLQTFKKIVLGINKAILSIPSIILSGTSGKTITAHFLTTLLNKEKLTVGSFSSPHFIQYNEQITINSKQISNTKFEEHATTLLNRSNEHNHTLHSHELLMGILLLQSFENKVDLLVLEQKNLIDLDPATLLTPRIVGITRLATEQIDLNKAIESIFSIVSPTTFVVSADQNKKNLLRLNLEAGLKKAQWLMPIRKIAPLPYPYEQLHGRCATLAERIAATYVSHFISGENETSLLNKPKNHRGRPTLETQKENQLCPTKTITEFWQESDISIPGRFQIIKTKQAPIVLDCARSTDAFDNLLLGIRLLAYKSAIQNIFIVAGSLESSFNHETFIKQIRYFFKRNNGKIFFCPIKPQSHNNSQSWDPEQICNIAKNIKIKSDAYPSFKDAFKEAQEQSDEKSLIIITGSTEIITEYWNYKHV